uniref:Reverse transcriptase domain-containing protein n=1 Tax=Spongospora subterranea TaxID=70186 RepID=A0A0H5R1U8_9EUKA|eukprot:CRZ08208.1 hypothetical protein [Spongospora subterranea]
MKAFDRVQRPLFIEKFNRMGIEPYLALLIDNWLTNRMYEVHYRNVQSSQYEQINGIPQGSSNISVLLWILYIYDAPLNMNNSNVYVDDTTQWEQGTSKKEVAEKLRESSSELYKWCKVNKIKLQWMKTFLL